MPWLLCVAEKELDIWAEGVVIPGAPAAPNPGYGSGPVRRKVKAKALPSKVAAVDIDHAGCSYNPDEEAHQVGVPKCGGGRASLQMGAAPVKIHHITPKL